MTTGTRDGAGSDSQEQALLRAIAEKSKEDPLIGAKIGSREIVQRLLAAMKNERGVHIESLLCALGSLAGYACQASLRAQAINRGMPPDAPFTVANTTDGKRYFFGDPLNEGLAGAKYSLWSLAGAAAQAAGCKELPDVHDIFRHVTATVGTEQFGVPRLPEGHLPAEMPVAYVKALWPAFLPVVKKLSPDPQTWPVLYGLATQQVIDMGKSVIDPGLAFRTVMESAIPMSKLDLAAA